MDLSSNIPRASLHLKLTSLSFLPNFGLLLPASVCAGTGRNGNQDASGGFSAPNPAIQRAGKASAASACLRLDFQPHPTYHLKYEGHGPADPHSFIESELQVLGRNI